MCPGSYLLVQVHMCTRWEPPEGVIYNYLPGTWNYVIKFALLCSFIWEFSAGTNPGKTEVVVGRGEGG